MNCNHTKTDVLNGGIRRCVDCKAIEGLDGLWRRWRGSKQYRRDTP